MFSRFLKENMWNLVLDHVVPGTFANPQQAVFVAAGNPEQLNLIFRFRRIRQQLLWHPGIGCG